MRQRVTLPPRVLKTPPGALFLIAHNGVKTKAGMVQNRLFSGNTLDPVRGRPCLAASRDPFGPISEPNSPHTVLVESPGSIEPSRPVPRSLSHDTASDRGSCNRFARP